jgi:acyl-CoA thioester hydrolase
MRQLGVPYAEIEEQEALFLPVIEAGAVYRAPARYDDLLRITTRVGWVRAVRIRLEYSVAREPDGTVLATGYTVHAAIDGEGVPRRLPERLVTRLSRSPEDPT